jgi:hypothetical protein
MVTFLFYFKYIYNNNNNNMTRGPQGGWVKSMGELTGKEFLFLFLFSKK